MTKDQTEKPFFDAWLKGVEDFKRMQLDFLSASDDLMNIKGSSDVIKQAQENWQKCEAQFESWLKAAQEWFPENNLQSMLSPSEFLNSSMDEFNQVFQRMSKLPEFADIGLFEKEFMQISQDWTNLRTANAAYQSEIAQAWSKAFESFLSEFPELNQKQEDAPTAHSMINHWLKIANKHLVTAQRTPEFLLAQKTLFKAATKYKLKQQELMESWCHHFDIPTRSEVDDLHKKVYEMRAEMRLLKKQLASPSPNKTSKSNKAATKHSKAKSKVEK